MQTWSAGAVNKTRTVVLWVLRCAAVVAVSAGVYFLIKRLIFAAAAGRLEVAYLLYDGTSEQHGFYRGIALLSVGLVVAASARIVSRWAIALPLAECPRCGYLPGGPFERCPECGLRESRTEALETRLPSD